MSNSNLREEVTKRIAETGGTKVKEAVINHLVEEEISKRVRLILSSLDELVKLKVDLKKVKPDLLSYDVEGNLVSSNFSKSKYEELSSLKDKQSKLESALNLALENDDYSKIKNIK